MFARNGTVTSRIYDVWTLHPGLKAWGLYLRPRMFYLHSANPYEAVVVFSCRAVVLTALALTVKSLHYAAVFALYVSDLFKMCLQRNSSAVGHMACPFRFHATRFHQRINTFALRVRCSAGLVLTVKLQQ